jgi:hypothetical protein
MLLWTIDYIQNNYKKWKLYLNMNPQMFMDFDLDKLRELKDSYKWIYSNYEVIKKNYKNQFIAISDEQHLDSDNDLERLLQRLKQNNLNGPIAIEYIYG